MIDAHMHFGDDSPEIMAFLKELDLKLLNICLANGPEWREQALRYGRLSRQYPIALPGAPVLICPHRPKTKPPMRNASATSWTGISPMEPWPAKSGRTSAWNNGKRMEVF